jgi:hypothetical protein
MIAPHIRAAARADLEAGDQPAVVAERYGIDGAIVRKWKQRYVTANVTDVTADVTLSQPVAHPGIAKRERAIGVLVVDLLAAKLEASEAIAKAASRPEWIDRQSGSELAALGEWLDSTAFAIGDRLAQRADRNASDE